MSRNIRRFPPLLPKGTGVSREPPRPLQPPRRRIATACEECRIRKAKCNGERPKCRDCTARGTECIYQEKPIVSLKERKYEDLAHTKSPHEELFEMLMAMSEHESYEVLQRIRAGADAATTLSQLKEGDLLLQLSLVPETRKRYQFPYLQEIPAFLLHPTNPYIDTLVFAYASSNRPRQQNAHLGGDANQSPYQHLYCTPYHAAEIVDSRIELTKPSIWTTACRNDILMRRLLRIYFVSEYHAGTFFQKDLFLDDMIAGQHQSCSPLLVNAVLAMACHSDRSNAHRAEFWNPKNLAYRFLAEARRLWELEASEPVLTTIQATLVLQMCCNMNGTDEIGYNYLAKAVEMAESIDLFTPSGKLDQKKQHGRDFTAWALYGWQGVMAYMHQKPPLCKRAPRSPLPDPLKYPKWYGNIIFKFPSSPTLFSTHFGLYIKAKLDLWITALDIALNISDKCLGLSAKQALAYCARLLQWHAALLEPLTAQRIATPYQLQLHMQYHNYLINLLEEPMATELKDSKHMDLIAQTVRQQPHDILSASKRSLETLIRLYYVRHGFEALDCFMIQYLSMLAFMAYDAIQQSTPEVPLQTLRSTVVLAAVGLRDQSRSHYVARMVFTAVRRRMGAEEIALIDHFTEQSRAGQSHPPGDWRSNSTFLMNHGSISKDREASNLSKLFDEARDGEVLEVTGAAEVPEVPEVSEVPEGGASG